MDERTLAASLSESKTFWDFYDKFCNPMELEILVKTGVSPMSQLMCNIMQVAHKERTIHNISRAEKGWKNHKAWLALRNAPIRNDRGDPAILMRAGDVIAVEWGWDRDIIITHNPISRNTVSGYLLSGRWEEMVGLFMPLYDKVTINKCIELRTSKNVEEAITLAKEEALDWQWY